LTSDENYIESVVKFIVVLINLARGVLRIYELSTAGVDDKAAEPIFLMEL
jgi:hypothetical protein